ncbi:MAG TPA: sigma-70 family RNA polymerase sigma factor [Gemmatimonadales bacterium]|jgi:RNA polymerase sigma factor (TIGR02999 family)
MTPPSRDRDVTTLLQAWGRGERAALDELLPLVYGELRRQAARRLRAQPEGHTLQATDLVHEAYLRLVDRGGAGADWHDRSHFFAVAARAMRSILVDHARARRTAKRGGGAPALTLGAADAASAPADQSSDPRVDVEALDEALTRLAALDPRQARVVELRYFGGLSIGEAAEALGVSHATVEREWRTARLWLRRELVAGGAG